MNKKGGLIGTILLLLVFFMTLFIIGGSITGLWRGGSESAGLTGLEAFFFSYPLVWIFFISILGVMAWLRFGSN